MKQHVNFNDKKILSLLQPRYWAKDVTDIDFEKLTESGINTVIFDIDNTLGPHSTLSVDPKILSAIHKALEKKKITQVAIATNRYRYNFEKIASQLGENVEYLYASGLAKRKPFKSYFVALLKKLNSKPEECVMVGDKILTDVIGANSIGINSLLVDRLGEASWYQKLIPFDTLIKSIIRSDYEPL
jgi:uncharacterized protein